MAGEVTATLDLTKFNPVFEHYLKVTSKTMQEATNNKLFDIARFSLKATEKANAGSIRSSLNQSSNNYPSKTVAEMIIISHNRKADNKSFDLKDEVKQLINRRRSAVGYTKSGWIKPMVQLMPFVGRKSLTAGGVSKIVGPGGAKPVKQPTNHMTGEIWNDVRGKDNESFVTHLKERGAQEGVNKAVADMEQYLEKKLAPHNREFNRG